jgi:hypothetical protein
MMISSGCYKLKFGEGACFFGRALKFVDYFQQFAGAELIAAIQAGNLDQTGT